MSEYAAWAAYLDIDPPEKYQWPMFAMLAINARRCAGDKKNLSPSQFMPDFDIDPVKETKELATILPGMPDHIAKRFVKAKEQADGRSRRRNSRTDSDGGEQKVSRRPGSRR